MPTIFGGPVENHKDKQPNISTCEAMQPLQEIDKLDTLMAPFISSSQYIQKYLLLEGRWDSGGTGAGAGADGGHGDKWGRQAFPS